MVFVVIVVFAVVVAAVLFSGVFFSCSRLSCRGELLRDWKSGGEVLFVGAAIDGGVVGVVVFEVSGFCFVRG